MTPQSTWFADIFLKNLTDNVRRNPEKYFKFTTEKHSVNEKNEMLEKFSFGKHEITINWDATLDDFTKIAQALAASFLNSIYEN